MQNKIPISKPHAQEAQAAENQVTTPLSPQETTSKMTFSSPLKPNEAGNLSSSPIRHSVPTSDSSPTPSGSHSDVAASPIVHSDAENDESHSFGLSPLSSSYEPRYSPPNVSAVSSSWASPVAASFLRPRHPRSESPNDVLSPSEVGTEQEREVAEEMEGHVPSDGERILEVEDEDESDERHDETTIYDWDYDDAGDVMNPPYVDGDGLVFPHVDGIVSVHEEQLDRVLNNGPGNSELEQDANVSTPASSSHTLIRRASSPTGRPLPSSCSPSETHIYRGTHVQFDTNASTQDTPFKKTLKYFKQFKDKENTPSKSRRNASLPEEIAELAKEAQQEGIENDNEMWEKYREADFAPIDSVMEDGQAGDLIMAGTPSRKSGVAVMADASPSVPHSEEVPTDGTNASAMQDKVTTKKIRHSLEDPRSSSHIESAVKIREDEADNQGPLYEINIPGHYDDAFLLQFRSMFSAEDIASFIRERGEALDASKEAIDRTVEEFLAAPGAFIVPDGHLHSEDRERDSPGSVQNLAGREGNVVHDENIPDITNDSQEEQEHPVFVKVIGMLPQAMLWAVAAPVAHYSNKAIDTVLEKFTGLSLD